MFTGTQIRQKYLDFFKKRGHVVIPSVPLVPENDPTTLFTGSGMQPMIPYLLGQPHPLGVRLVDSQKCFRAQDIEEVGDNRHDTFFEMLGNWSLGDYFKKEQQVWIWEFFTKELSLDPKRLYVSVFEGNTEVPKDQEAVNVWKSLGVKDDHIYYYGVGKNWWARSSFENMPVGEPGGPDSEVFYDFGGPHDCHPNCDCGRFMEIGNNVFMTYKKTESGFEPLAKKNIDFGGGLERITAVANNYQDIFKTDLYLPIINVLGGEISPTTRIIADHLKASVFLIDEGLIPSNKAQGYFLRRLLRRAAVKMKQLGMNLEFSKVITAIFEIYPMYLKNIANVNLEVSREMTNFQKTLDLGLKLLDKASPFDLFQSYGFPIEITEELYKQKGLILDRLEFENKMKQHQDLSRTAGKGMFKGGLQDSSEVTTRYHTATHLLHAALRKILGSHVSQKGSNITSERLRFDFSHPDKLTSEQILQIEDLVNQKIDENIEVNKLEMKKDEALKMGALAFFPEKYPDVTSVYKIGDYSMELCGGPHVTSTSEIGRFKINREESAGAGIRRIYATALFPPQTKD
ncbi:MAG: alanine--tRNA ligase [Candidatus Amesbacteria bacterium]|nr:alanine--tRNA ligase [Candidatus Amesbacteria bacterium]